MDASQKIGQRRVHQQVVQRVSVSGGDQLNTALRNGARGLCLGFSPDLVNDDHLWRMVLDGFDHDRVLKIRPRHLHPPAGANPRMRDIPISGNFIRGVHDDHPLFQFRRQDSRTLAQQGRLADSGSAEKQDALSRLDDIPQYIDSAVNGAPYAAGQPHHNVPPVPNTGNPVKGPLNTGAIVHRERTHAVNGVLDVFSCDGLIRQIDRTAREVSLGLTAKIQDDLDKIPEISLFCEGFFQRGRHDAEEKVKIVSDFLAWQFSLLLVDGSIC
jgi:hypothetical protein